MKKMDVGITWGKIINIWGQIGVVQGVINTIMLFVVTYNTSLKNLLPVWLYILIIVISIICIVGFVLRIGISGYYRFFNQQSAMNRIESKVDKTEAKLDKICKKIGIEE